MDAVLSEEVVLAVAVSLVMVGAAGVLAAEIRAQRRLGLGWTVAAIVGLVVLTAAVAGRLV